MQHRMVFDDKIVHRFNFKGEYVGYVLDNSDFEETLEVKVFIPELFGYNYTPAIKNIDQTLNISTSHILNREELNIITELTKQEYVYSRILIDRGSLTGTKDNFLKQNKPEIGDKIIVSFFNDNPNNCIYENKIFLTEGESLSIMEGDDTATNIIKIINKNSKEKKPSTNKITWEYVRT